MIRSWLGWLVGKGDNKADRRNDVAPAAFEVGQRDLDPLTGALRWERFMTMLDVEQAQAPGVLLLIDLSARTGQVAATASARDENLPWLAQAIRQAIRSDDLLAHVSGYRFAVLLRGAPLHLGEAISSRILESVDDTIFMTADGIAELEMSIGGVSFDGGARRDVVAAATAHLDQARQSGKPAIIQ
ncbi:MAG: diguanylate cyclase [Alphaproteobacteria bacterium]|nr:diguanylate cyclase [Alphaproteobacteria bacterium]MBU1561593.1 diguanylate cyclase [Alphaproteobacteria bacterium]MBU2302426.1 diguanylate cyclase [Alphaproteobacteria bacterium]MBU2368706.1 diguanylate cyclase [Alphaproteobacteria bacterium]